jgi:hypothetical protein
VIGAGVPRTELSRGIGTDFISESLQPEHICAVIRESCAIDFDSTKKEQE